MSSTFTFHLKKFRSWLESPVVNSATDASPLQFYEGDEEGVLWHLDIYPQGYVERELIELDLSLLEKYHKCVMLDFSTESDLKERVRWSYTIQLQRGLSEHNVHTENGHNFLPFEKDTVYHQRHPITCKSLLTAMRDHDCEDLVIVIKLLRQCTIHRETSKPPKIYNFDLYAMTLSNALVTCDVVLCIYEPSSPPPVFTFDEGKSVFAHKCVLAAHSPVWNAQFFTSGLKESRRKVDYEVVVALDYSVQTLQMLVRFCYLGDLHFRLDDVEEVLPQCWQLLNAADKYQIDALFTCVEEELMERITFTTICEIYLTARQYLNATKLRDACAHFIKSKCSKLPKALICAMSGDLLKMLVEYNHSKDPDP